MSFAPLVSCPFAHISHWNDNDYRLLILIKITPCPVPFYFLIHPERALAYFATLEIIQR
jgi:hypothetical protein